MRWLVTILVIILTMLQYRLWVGEGSLAEVWQLRQAVARQQRENAHQSELNRVLAAEVIDLKQGQEAVEERARHDLGMIKEGEIFYQIVGSPGK